MLQEAERLFATETFDRVTLAAVAGAAGVTIPTVQRAFGSKEGLFAAVAARVRERVLSQRATACESVGDAVDALLAHYERDGAMMWHLLRQEADVALLAAALPEARAVHREWVEQVFRHLLRGLRGGARTRRVDALVAASDLYLWKLLRIDLGRSSNETAATMRALILAVAGDQH